MKCRKACNKWFIYYICQHMRNYQGSAIALTELPPTPTTAYPTGTSVGNILHPLPLDAPHAGI